MSDSDDNDRPEEGPQVRVSLKLASGVGDPSLEVPSAPIAVPSDIGRKGLSAVVNHLLGRSVPGDDDNDDDGNDDDSSTASNRPLSFEFIVANNRLLRKGVEKEARQHGLSLEEAIVITYFPTSGVPELSGEGETVPDWVSCFASASTNHSETMVFSGCYDGTIHIYRKRNNDDNESCLIKISSATAATGPIKAMAATTYKDQIMIASASLDHSLNLHTHDSNNGLQLYGVCTVAESDVMQAVSSLDFTATSSSSHLLLASGDANGTISIWNFDAGEQDSVATEAKKQKSSSGQKAASSKRELNATICMERAHAQTISGISWGNHHHRNQTDNITSHSQLITGSWDHSIKVWDVEKQNCLLTLNGSRVVACLDTSYHSEGVVATGHPDCTIRLWDVRVDSNTSKPSSVIMDHTFRPSHKAWVSDVKWSLSNAYQLASTSHDGTVKVWDIRSSNPLSTVRAFGKEEKGLCLLWDSSPSQQRKQPNHETIFAGGSDCIIKQLQL
ncbi:myosin heavy-chain kinase [Nitzschia inconspicua]|uniref:Myosin heavy-chain kinase n=1 Tax=Nitzschia inconspicua TaxID=303405 RepID=A0A9K3M0N1_9STRA|nr:myosin heavy-chain kinase [Nitzschia inconspicua]